MNSLVPPRISKDHNEVVSNRTLNKVLHLIKCRICDGTVNDPTTIMDCMHTFCNKCILAHMSKDNSCPECKQPISSRRSLRKHVILRSIVELMHQQKEPIYTEEPPKKKTKLNDLYMVIIGCEVEKKFDFSPVKLSMIGSTIVNILQKFLSAKITKTMNNADKIQLCYIKSGKKEPIKPSDTIESIHAKAKTSSGNIFLFFNMNN